MKNILVSAILLFVCSSSPVFANVVGTDLQNFNPNSNGLDFISVFSSDTLEPGVVNFGAFWMYQTNSMPFFEQGTATSGQKFAEPNDTMTSGDLHMGFGIIKGWDIGVGGNFVLSQDIDNATQLGTYADKGLTDMRVNTKVRLHRTASSGLALIGGVNFDRVGNNPYSGVDDSQSYSLDLAYDRLLGKKWRWGLNLGYRLRGSGDPVVGTGVTPMTDQLAYSAALSYFAESWKSHFMFELFGSSPTGDVVIPTDRETSNLEALFGWRWNMHKRFDFHAGLGTEVYHGLSTPDIRAYLGFNWRIGPLWGGANNSRAADGDRDGDGVLDSQDRCPNTPADERDSVNEYGCSDSDGDGVFNDRDKCPDTPRGASVDGSGCEQGYGIGKRDSDNDGVLDSEDQCPSTVPGTAVDAFGCDLKRVQTIRLDQLNFVTGTAKLVPSSRQKFDENISTLKDLMPTIERIIVEGHTDSVGREELNERLSEGRASRIAELLSENLNIDRSMIQSFGYGESRPIATNKTKAGRLKNRRVELRLIRKK